MKKRVKYPVFKQGTLLFVDFGENVGYEYRYKHFAIVLNNNDSDTSASVIVVPLTSKDRHNRHVKLEKSVINSIVMSNLQTYLRNVEASMRARAQNDVARIIRPNDGILMTRDKVLIDYVSKHNALLMVVNNELMLKWLEEDRKKATAVSEHYKQYNKYSYARLDSIRQIDKSRIVQGINDLDPINKVVLPEKYLKKVQKAFENIID